MSKIESRTQTPDEDINRIIQGVPCEPKLSVTQASLLYHAVNSGALDLKINTRRRKKSTNLTLNHFTASAVLADRIELFRAQRSNKMKDCNKLNFIVGSPGQGEDIALSLESISGIKAVTMRDLDRDFNDKSLPKPTHALIVAPNLDNSEDLLNQYLTLQSMGIYPRGIAAGLAHHIWDLKYLRIKTGLTVTASVNSQLMDRAKEILK